MQLSLWLSRTPHVELVQVRFGRFGKTPRDSYRGKSLMYQNDAGLFQWTAAVKAFTVLTLATKGMLLSGKNEPYVLSGEQGSPAAALDFAISKPTSWVVDMFGREQNGKAYARIVFKRENSEQKRPGPVRISLSPQLLEAQALKVFCDGIEVVTEKELRQLLELVSSDKNKLRREPSKEVKHEVVFNAEWFKSLLETEINFSLTETYLLDAMTVRLTAERVLRERSEFKKEMQKLTSSLIKELPPENARYVKSSTKFRSGGIKKIACSPIAVGALCILHYLKEGILQEVEINASYPSTSAIVETGDIDSVDIAVLSWGAALKLQRSSLGSKFRPVMLLPRSTFGIILLPQVQSPQEIKRVLLGDDPYGYPVEFIRRAQEFGRIPTQVKNIRANASEIMMHLNQMGDAAVIGFPLSAIIAKKYKAKILWAQDDALRVGDNVLMVRNTIPSQELISAIRAAWFSLLDQPSLVQETSAKIFSEVSFINYLYRQAALYRAS
jgi:hypothetical protein